MYILQTTDMSQLNLSSLSSFIQWIHTCRCSYTVSNSCLSLGSRLCLFLLILTWKSLVQVMQCDVTHHTYTYMIHMKHMNIFYLWLDWYNTGTPKLRQLNGIRPLLFSVSPLALVLFQHDKMCFVKRKISVVVSIRQRHPFSIQTSQDIIIINFNLINHL